MNFSVSVKKLFTLALFAGAAFCSISSANTDTPLLRVGRTITTPQIDGHLADSAWANSITLSDFKLLGSNRPANEQTQVQFLYDDDNLYVGWHCRESLLVVQQQRMHEVRTNIRTRDGDVLSDDNVLLFLQPDGSDTAYEFNLNSVGTLFDASSKRDDLWGARNASWNSNATAAALQEDGSWTAELAIPWQAFGLNAPPIPGANWNIGLARRATGRGENSSWSQHDSALHLISNWGQLIFDNAVTGISPQPLAPFEGGKSNFNVQLSAQTSEITIEATVNENNKTSRFQKAVTPGKQGTLITLPVTATTDTLLWQWSAKKADGKLLYRSPQLLVSAQSAQARLKISTQAPWKLFINQVLFREGTAAENQEISFPLVKGINDLIVEVQSGTARLELIPPVHSSQESIAWRTAPITADRKSARNQWAIAPEQNGVIGTSGNPALLQHTLLWKATPHYPVTEPAFYIAQGTTQQLTFIVEGLEGLPLDDWNAVIAVPQELEVLGSSGLYGKFVGGKAQFHTAPAGETAISGRRFNLYRVSADKPLNYKKNQSALLVTFEVLLRLRQGQLHDPAKEWPLYYWTRGNKNSISETPQSFRIRTAPALRGKQPKKFVWELWSSFTHVYDDRELLRNVLDTSQQAGFNKYLASSWKDFNDMVREYGMKAFFTVMFKDSRTFGIVQPYLAQHPDEKLVDKTGKPLNDYMCTTQLLGDNWPVFAKSIQDWMLKADLDAVEFDYEYPPFNPPHACFCNRCLIEFRKFSRLDGSLELTPDTIAKNYAPQWVDFMANRAATLLSKMKQAIHEANPKVKFTAYSGYYSTQDTTTKTRYGIDWNLIGQMQAIDEAGMGYGRPVPGITDSIAALRGIPVKFGELLVPYIADIYKEEDCRYPVAPLKKANLIRRALDATGGVLIYERKAMDGRSWYALGEATRLTADFEELFLNQRPVTLVGQQTDQIQVVKGKQQSLVCVLNDSAKPATYEFHLPAELGQGREYYSEKKVARGETIHLTLEPGEAAVYVLQTN